VLDQLDAVHAFDLPPKMVAAEFDNIWKEVAHAIEHGHLEEDDKDKSEDELKAEYRTIAERRVRLGLGLAEIGNRNKLDVTQEELARAINREAMNYPGQERQVVEFYQKNPGAVAQVRAPIYEEKVVDYILELASVTEVTVSKEALYADEDEAPAAKPAKKAAAKKPAAKKAKAESADAKADAPAAKMAPANKTPAATNYYGITIRVVAEQAPERSRSGAFLCGWGLCTVVCRARCSLRLACIRDARNSSPLAREQTRPHMPGSMAHGA
jgi:trigger factor